VKFGELKFLDSAHVKDLLAALRFAQNPRDRVAGFRLMQLLPGVGPASVQRILDRMDEQPGSQGGWYPNPWISSYPPLHPDAGDRKQIFRGN
jgi:hypothetical protein